MIDNLAAKDCIPCRGGTPPLQGVELRSFHDQIGNGWELMGNHHIEKEYKFKDFRQPLHFTNLIGELAEQQGHHPDIYLAWGKVRVMIWTHKIDGLSESDFILAAKIERLHKEMVGK